MRPDADAGPWELLAGTMTCTHCGTGKAVRIRTTGFLLPLQG